MARVTVLLLIAYIVFGGGIYHTWEKREKEIFARHITVLESTYKTTIHLYQLYAETVYDEVINKPELLQIIDEAYDASTERQIVLRGRLYRLLYSSYNRLADNHLRQLQFHFPDNSSFIRFHRLEKYGDSLTDTRESVRLVNANHTPISGFEIGRIFNGFRYVFPLQYKEKHVGSVETSISFKAIQNAMKAAVPNHDHLFIQKKDIALAKSFPSERLIYTSVALAPGYVVEDLRVIGLDTENPIFPIAQLLNPILGTNKKVQKYIEENSKFAISITKQNKSYVIAGLPIYNIKGAHVAYILSYRESGELQNLWAIFKIIALGMTALMFLLAFFIWKRQEVVTLLSSNEKRLNAITQNIGDSLYVMDAHGKITFVNRTMEKQLGYSSDELLGQSAHDLFHRHKQFGIIEKYGTCYLLDENMSGHSFENDKDFYLHKNGSTIPVEVKGTPLLLRGNKQGSVVIFRDITDRLQAEEDRMNIVNSKLESIGVLAGGIAHDFNNLLTAILGNIQIAKVISVDNLEVVKLLDEAQHASKRATKLTNQLLAFSKGGSLCTSEVVLETFLPDIVSFILAGSPVHCEFKFEDGLWHVQIDIDQIQQAIHNILKNAIEATKQDCTVAVHCSNHRGSTVQTSPLLKGKYVCIKIQDRGRGISSEHINKVFDPYFSTKDKGSKKGSGLGLSIVHSIIKKHKGHIEIESSKDKGTIFAIYLPAIVENDECNSAQHPDSGESPTGSIRLTPSTHKTKILVMDDEEMVRDVAKAQLITLGYEPVLVNDGVQAINRYQELQDCNMPVDVLIMDLTISGGMGGQEAAEKLLQIDKQAKIIVASGYSNDPVMDDYKKYGFCAAVTKPFDLAELRHAIEIVLS